MAGATLAPAWTDTLLLVRRQLRHLKRGPEKVIPVVMTPLVLVLLNGLLFGSAIPVPNGTYVDFFMAGIFAQVAIMGMTNSSSGLREDLRNGLVDRFQSLPIPRWSAVVARSVAELCTMLVGFLVLALVGYAIGWRIHEGLLLGLAAIGLLMLFGYLMVWLGMLVTVIGRNPETGSGVFMLMMPLLFISNAFVPLDGLPVWVRTVAEWNPFSAVVLSCRQLWGNPSPVYTDAFPTQHPVIVAIALPIVLLAVIMYFTVRRYQTVVSR